MILTLIFIGVLVLGIVGLILYDKAPIYRQLDFIEFLSISFIIIGLIGSIVCVTLIGVAHTKNIAKAEEIRFEEKQESLNSTYEYLTSNGYYSPSIVEITSYNKEVSDFKSEIRSTKIKLKNPWINWFVCPAASKFDENSVEYLVYPPKDK